MHRHGPSRAGPPHRGRSTWCHHRRSARDRGRQSCWGTRCCRDVGGTLSLYVCVAPCADDGFAMPNLNDRMVAAILRSSVGCFPDGVADGRRGRTNMEAGRSWSAVECSTSASLAPERWGSRPAAFTTKTNHAALTHNRARDRRNVVPQKQHQQQQYSRFIWRQWTLRERLHHSRSIRYSASLLLRLWLVGAIEVVKWAPCF